MIRSGTRTSKPNRPLDPKQGVDQRAESKAFHRLKAELEQCFAAPDSAYRPMTAADVIARNKA